jgi:Na+/proline symporter
MELHTIDIAIIVLYLGGMIAVGFAVERRASGGISSYFLGSNQMPWWLLSMSNAASMFDISGTMWLVSLLYVYGLKSVFIPWLWPVFNQIFLMVYLSAWLRRSKAMTGAEWITMRFGNDHGAEASRISVVVFALVSVVAFTVYAFVGLTKFSDVFLPKVLSPSTYALIIVAITTLYTVMGGLYSVVLTDLFQFVIKLVCCAILGGLAMWTVSPTLFESVVPAGWADISFGWILDLNWSDILPKAQQRIDADGYTMFGAFFMMTLLKGVLVSSAGPAPNYDMQRILAAKSPREASLMSAFVTVALFVPRYFMIAGVTVLALAFMKKDVTHGENFDLEQVLPIVIRDFLPVGVAGLLISGLLAAFMSTFSGTINAAAAYVVNDVYKRYVRPAASDREYIYASYAASLLLVVVGCTAGYFAPSVHQTTDWIVSALWSGYAAPNILKWHWWRFNGWGYFFGMISGIAGALLLCAMPNVRPLEAFPALILTSAAGAVIGSLATRQERESVLVDFYVRTRPWGLWAPIRRRAHELHPEFVPNQDFAFDILNVLIGIIWQTSFVALPIYVVIQHWREAAICFTLISITSFILKHTWYDRLRDD